MTKPINYSLALLLNIQNSMTGWFIYINPMIPSWWTLPRWRSGSIRVHITPLPFQLPPSHCKKQINCGITLFLYFPLCISHLHTSQASYGASVSPYRCSFLICKMGMEVVRECKGIACYLLCPYGDCIISFLERLTSGIIPKGNASAFTQRDPFSPQLCLVPVL